MDRLTAINKVAADTGISSRTLRYWETAGLFTSSRDAQSGWRMYDSHALQCIRITDCLRRLDVSIRDIKKVMEDRTIDSLCRVLKKRLSTISKAHSDLSLLETAISELVTMLEAESRLTLPLLEDSLANIRLPVALVRKKHVITKLQGGYAMAKNKYDEVKLVKMAQARAIAFSHVGVEPEDDAYGVVKEWLDKNNLNGTARIFGFNTEPYPSVDNPAYGFGYCATIPEGIEISAPLYEIRIPGGAYALIPDDGGGPETGWPKVHGLCSDSEWEWTRDDKRTFCPGLEEHIYLVEGGPIIHILFPVKKKPGK